MACHKCKVTGIKTCDPEEAEIKCSLCNFCKNKDDLEAKKRLIKTQS